MNSKKHPTRKLLNEVLATCLDDLRQDKASLCDCLERFPQYRDELEPLLRKSLILNNISEVKPRPELITNVFCQLMEQLSTRQSVTKQPLVRNINNTNGFIFHRRLSMLQIIIALVFALISATGGVVYASDAAEPGNSLYGLDLAIEQLGLFLAPNGEAAARLHLDYASERLEEARGRLVEGDIENTILALEAYGKEIASLAQLLGNEQGDLTYLVNTALSVHQEILTGLLSITPVEAHDAILGAIENGKLSFDTLGEVQNGKEPAAAPPDEVPPSAPPMEVPPVVPPVEAPPVVPPAGVPPVPLPMEAPPVVPPVVPPVEPPVEAPPVVPPVGVPPVEFP